MKPDEVQAVAAIAQAVLAFVAVISAIGVSLFVYSGTVRVAKSQYHQTVFNAWMALDTCVLNKPELLAVMESIDRPGRTPGQSTDPTKRILSFMLLNPLCTFFYGVKNGYIERESLAKVEASLIRILVDDEVYRLTQDEVFGERFANFCKEIKAKLNKPAEPVAAVDPPKAAGH